MALLVVTINDPGMQKKSSEVANAIKCLGHVMTEIGRGNGNITSGVITGVSSAGVPNTALGAWTYVPTATLP